MDRSSSWDNFEIFMSFSYEKKVARGHASFFNRDITHLRTYVVISIKYVLFDGRMLGEAPMTYESRVDPPVPVHKHGTHIMYVNIYISIVFNEHKPYGLL